MESNTNQTSKWKKIPLIALLALLATGILAIRLESNTSAFASDAPTTFPSPTEAGGALAKAAQNDDQTALRQILGQDTNALFSTGDERSDEAALQEFGAKYAQMNRWVDMSDGSRVLHIGADNFAFPVPLVKNSSGRWYFDAVAGAEEIRARDIGRNELLTIDACAAIANAEDVYYIGVGATPEFAQRIISTSGKQDGLYWPANGNQASSPLSAIDGFPQASLSANPWQDPFRIDGYSIRILTAQGDAAPGGRRNYILDGKMSGGFAILASPVKYGETGIMTFMTGSDGIVYERDLGPDTTTIALSIEQFNPTDDWSPVE